MIIKTIVSLGLVAMVAFSGCSETAVENLKESGKAIEVRFKPSGFLRTKAYYLNSNVLFTGLATITKGKHTYFMYIKNGIKNGMYQKFKKDKMMISGYLKNGKKHRLWTEWHENGQLKSEIHYENGHWTDWTEWHENGQIRLKV